MGKWEGWLCRVEVGVDDNTEQEQETQKSAFVRNVRLMLGFSLGRLHDVDCGACGSDLVRCQVYT